MVKKTYNQKLNDAAGLPKIEDISDHPELVKRIKGSRMLIASPLQYNEIMAKVPKGKIITADKIRDYLAKKSGADITCPLTAGIFINICAHASVERENDKIPYWRTLKAKGELNEKFPEGIDAQKFLLEKEGHRVIQKGKKYYLVDYEKDLWIID